MGAMECSRNDCDRVMCESYVPEIGYICSECVSEFKASIGRKPIAKRKIETKLKEFIETSKGSFSENEKISIDDFFEGFDTSNHYSLRKPQHKIINNK